MVSHAHRIPEVCIYNYVIFILGTDLFYVDVIVRHRKYEYVNGFKFVIINKHVLKRIICDAVTVFTVEIPLHCLL